jgi:excisionase family DNA binding protein
MNTATVIDNPTQSATSLDSALLIADTAAAALLGISRAHIHRLRAAGKFIEPIRLGRKLLFDRDELIAWKNARCPDIQTWRAMREQNRRLRTVG